MYPIVRREKLADKIYLMDVKAPRVAQYCEPGQFVIVKIDEKGAVELARRSRGTPRLANRILKRVRDFAQVKGNGKIDTAISTYALEALNIDKHGLDEVDNKILLTIIDKFNGGPVGISTIATAVSDDIGTIEEVYEPFLIKEGFIKRTPRGREVTDLAYQHLGRKRNSEQGLLFWYINPW